MGRNSFNDMYAENIWKAKLDAYLAQESHSQQQKGTSWTDINSGNDYNFTIDNDGEEPGPMIANYKDGFRMVNLDVYLALESHSQQQRETRWTDRNSSNNNNFTITIDNNRAEAFPAIAK